MPSQNKLQILRTSTLGKEKNMNMESAREGFKKIFKKNMENSI